MTECYQTSIPFSSVKNRRVEADFTGGDITSDAGVLLLSEVDKRLGLTVAIDKALVDNRRRASCNHSQLDLIRQRLYALALGYEDLNDHTDLRHDTALQAAVSRLTPMASSATLCRFEQKANRQTAKDLHQLLFDQFVARHEAPPKRLILDFDATDTRLHGDQERKFFHGYYDHYCYLPLYVFCGRDLLVSYLRPSNIDGAKHAWAILSLLVKALRQRWPKVKITLRADSGFCRWRMLDWCERHRVDYVVGIARNSRLETQASEWTSLSQELFDLTRKKQRVFASTWYAAKTWNRKRRVIVKAEHSRFGSNPRFVITNLTLTDRHIYDNIYCARGDMENRIKDQQLGLFADRTSCRSWWANQFRQLLSGLAGVLLEGLRRLSLTDTVLSKASPQRIRLVLLKIGAVVIRNTRRIRLFMSSAYPYQSLYRHVAHSLNSS